MATMELLAEEYLWFDEYQQGNVNVVGLVFDDFIEETIDLGPEEVLTVYSDMVEETLDFAEGDFTGIHWGMVSDSITLREVFGTPLRVKQTVLNLAMTNPVAPALIANIHLDVLYGVDIYWEEVSDELQIHSSHTNAVPYYWEWIYESLDIDMTEPQPRPPIGLTLKLLVNDLVNTRHEVTQEYLFNSKCFEEFFVWERLVWGWPKLLNSELISAEAIQEIIGKMADEYIFLDDGLVQRVKIRPLIDDRFFVWDTSDRARFYVCLANETIAIADGQVSFVAGRDFDTILETFGISEAITQSAVYLRLASESLVFADISSFVHDLIVEEGIALGDVELTRWVFQVLIESGCDIADIIA